MDSAPYLELLEKTAFSQRSTALRRRLLPAAAATRGGGYPWRRLPVAAGAKTADPLEGERGVGLRP
jgi:secreted protein with Ig-like and vWFA domain